VNITVGLTLLYQSVLQNSVFTHLWAHGLDDDDNELT